MDGRSEWPMRLYQRHYDARDAAHRLRDVTKDDKRFKVKRFVLSLRGEIIDAYDHHFERTEKGQRVKITKL